MTEKHKDLFVPLLFLPANLVLKGIFLSAGSLAGDEPFSVYHAQMDVPSIIRQLLNGNNPPLYEILLHGWIRLFGISEFSVRFPSLLFGSLAVYFLFRMAKRHFSETVAWAASLLMTFSVYHTAFAHEARTYAWFALLTVVSVSVYLDILSGEATRKRYALLLLCNVLMVYSHYFGFFVVGTQTLFVLLDRSSRKRLGSSYLVFLGLFALCCLPNMANIARHLFRSSVQGTWVKAPEGIGDLYLMLWSFSNVPASTVFCIALLAAAAIACFVRKDYRCLPLPVRFVLLWFTLPFFFMFAVSFKVPIFLDRYLVFVSPAYYLLLAMCAGYILRRGIWPYLLPAVLCLLFIATYTPNPDNKRHVRETVEKVRALKTPQTVLWICPKPFVLNFAYYYNRDIFEDVDPVGVYDGPAQRLAAENIYVLNHIGEIGNDTASHLLYLDAGADFSAPGNHIRAHLDKDRLLLARYPFYDLFVLYEYRWKR